MNKRWMALPALLPVLAAAPRALAAQGAMPTSRAGAAPRVPQISFKQYVLPNGLRVVLSRDTTAPVVAACVTYDVGSFVEPQGRTGFAHLFEHMMFQGSKNVGKGEHVQLVVDNGGTMNGTTNTDRTNFFEQVPANQLELVLFLEADRMGTLDISQQNLDNQRAVVQEERRRSYENRPYGLVPETQAAAAFQNFAWKHTTIGSMADLNAADLSYVRNFFHTYYSPNNAVLAIVGDFDESKAMGYVAKYFGPIPSGPKPPFPNVAEPAQTEEHRVTLPDPLAPLPAYFAGYHIPAETDPDAPALQVLGSVLAGGKSSRLYQALVETQQVATDVNADGGSGRGPGLFSIDLSFAPGQDITPAEKALDAEIARVQSDGVTPDEVKKAQAQERRFAIARLRSSMFRAQQLSLYGAVYNDPNRVNTELPRLFAVTPADVQRVAKKYLVTTNRTVVIAQPAPAATPAGTH